MLIRNGQFRINICSSNELRIRNAYLEQKTQYKYMFRNYRDQKSTIDYIVTNENIQPNQILDKKTLKSANNGREITLYCWLNKNEDQNTKI